MGSIYQRKSKQADGTWKELPTLWIKYIQNGRVMRESTKTTKETVARRILRSREGDVEHGNVIIRKPVKFEDAAADLVADYKINKKRSRAKVERLIDLHLKPVFQGRFLSNITTADVRAYTAARLDAGAKSATVNRELAALKRTFVLAVQAGKLASRPHIPMLRENNIRTGFFEAEQLRAVLAHLPEYARPIVTFAYLTGWRSSEITTLQWRQVDLEAGEVRLDAEKTKNREGRVFPFDLMPALRTLLEGRDEQRKALKESGTITPWVFLHEDGTQAKNFRGAWKAACKAAGVPGRLVHDLRRTAVRNLVRAGVSEQVAMKLTGHKTRSVFDRYDIVSGDDLSRVLKK
jgi:integrase